MEHQEGTESTVVAFPAAAGVAPQLARDPLAAPLASRLRALQRICAVMLAGVAMLAGASLVVVRLRVLAVPVPAVASTDLSLTLTALAAVLILLTSRFQSTILGRSARGVLAAAPRLGAASAGAIAAGPPGAAAAAQTAAAQAAVAQAAVAQAAVAQAAVAQAAVIAGAYVRATIVGFALLDAAAALGLAVAGVTGTARYALVVCAAAALGMLARWPRRAAVLALLRRSGLTGDAG